MALPMKQFIDRFKAMEKIANETLAADPEALVGVDSLPGSEHDQKVPEDAKKPDPEVAQGQPAGAESAAGAVNGGDAKVLNEGKLEIDEPLLNPEKKPLISDDALTAKTAGANLESIVSDLLSDIGSSHKDKAEKSASGKLKLELDNDTISKIAAAQATYMLGRKAAEEALSKQAAEDEAVAARNLIKATCIKAAQDAGLSPEEAASAADNAMAMAGVAPADAAVAAAAADEAQGAADAAQGAADAEVAAQDAADAEAAAQGVPDSTVDEIAQRLPDDVTEEELGEAIVELVESGELDADTAKAVVDAIAGDEGGASEDEAAQIIADGLESGEITPEQAKEIVSAIEGGSEAHGAADAEAAAQDAADEAQGAADAEAAAQDAIDEARGAADAEEAIKTAAAKLRENVVGRIASKVVEKRASQSSGSPIMDKVIGILQKKAAAKPETPSDAAYMEGFKKKAAELGVDPSALARYAVENAKA